MKRVIALFLFLPFFVVGIDIQPASPILLKNWAGNRLEKPLHFRMSFSGFKSSLVEKLKNLPSTTGLENLHASGSAQFSCCSLNQILQHIREVHNGPIYDIDLRQESHGFVLDNNDTCYPISWFLPKDSINWGKTFDQIQKDQQALLDSIEHTSVTMYRAGKTGDFAKTGAETAVDPLTIDATTAFTEEELAACYQINYFHLPVRDHHRPSDDNVDTFINFVKELPSNAWLHMHCAEGFGRTTTFLAMYDMMRNADKVTLEDIVQRQWLLGGVNLFNKPHYEYKQSSALARDKFLKDFYGYAHAQMPNFNVSFSDWMKSKMESSHV